MNWPTPNPAQARKALQARLLAEGKRLCSKCRAELPINAFSSAKHGWCRECRRKDGARYRKPTRLETIAQLEYILQAICWWPDEFYEDFCGGFSNNAPVPALKAWADSMNEHAHTRAQEGSAR